MNCGTVFREAVAYLMKKRLCNKDTAYPIRGSAALSHARCGIACPQPSGQKLLLVLSPPPLIRISPA
jgi:hypothetical protein